MNYYIANIGHSKREDKYITFWRPDDKGYAWPLSWAGKYPDARVREHLDYYNSGDNVAVPCEVVEALAVAPFPGTVDGDAGPVVLSCASNWKILLKNVVEPPARSVKPKYPYSRKTKESTNAI